MKLSKGFRRVALGSMLGTSTLMATSQALAAFAAFVSIKGQRQGQFKGEGIQDKRKDKWMPVLSFSFGAKSPRDVATGGAAGRRQYEPMCVVKEWGAATPQILNALASNEALPEVNFEFMRSSATGAEYVYQTIKLTNATVASVKQYTGTAGAAAARSVSVDTQSLEEVCFTFQKVEIANSDGKTMFADDWRSVP